MPEEDDPNPAGVIPPGAPRLATEGSRYLGFIFSRAATPAEAEAALRRAHALLEFKIR